MNKIQVRINKIDNVVDEVMLYREDPYVNRVVYAKPGIFEVGELSDDDVMVLEQKSKAILAKEHADKLAAEEKAREAEEKAREAEAEEVKAAKAGSKTAAPKKREG